MAKIRKIYDDAIKPDGSKQVIYPVTSTRAVYTTSNVTLDKVLSEGYRFGGIVLPTDSPSITDQRVFYGASVPGVYTSFGNIAVDSGEAIFLLYDGEHWEKGIFGGAGYSTLTGFKALASIQDLPREETQFGYLINGHLYVWVGENGDTLDGLYLDCGELRGASAYEVAVRNGYRGTEQEWLNDPIHGIKGISVKSVECIHEALEDGGTNIWRITLTNGNSTDFEVKNGNQGNSGYQGAAGELEVVNNLTDGGATAALSAEMGKAIVDLYGTYVTNPEFVKVWLDKEDRILMAIRNDGDIYFGVGTPSQVKAYIEERIDDLGLQDYEKLVNFVGELIDSPKTLSELFADVNAAIDTKVDKEKGKSLIDSEHADAASHTDNPEYLQVTTDSEDKVLEGLKQDGTKFIGGDLNVGGSASINGDIRVLGNMEVSGVSYKVIENPEYLAAWVDASDKVIFGLKADGKTYVGDADFLNDIKNNQEAINEIKSILANIPSNIDWDALSSITAVENPEYINVKVDLEDKILEGITSEGVKQIDIPIDTPSATIKSIEDPEGRTDIKTDSVGRVLAYRDNNGMVHECVGIKANSSTFKNIEVEEEINFKSGIPSQIESFIYNFVGSALTRTVSNPYSNVDFDNSVAVLSNTHEHIFNQDTLERCYNRGVRNINLLHYSPSAPQKFDLDYQVEYEDYTSATDLTKTTKLSPKRNYSDFVDKDGNNVSLSDIVVLPNCEHVNIQGYPYMLHSNFIGSEFAEPGWEKQNGDTQSGVTWRIEHPILTDSELFEGVRNKLPFNKVFGTLNHPTDSIADFAILDRFIDNSNGLIQAIEVFSNGYTETKNQSFEDYYDYLLGKGKKLWCVAVEDWQSSGDSYANDAGANLLLLPSNYNELTYIEKQNAILDAYISGQYFPVGKGDLRIVSINQNSAYITIRFNKEAEVVYGIFDGNKEVVGTNTSMVTVNLLRAYKYFRLKAVDANSDFIFTNPIFIDYNN